MSEATEGNYMLLLVLAGTSNHAEWISVVDLLNHSDLHA